MKGVHQIDKVMCNCYLVQTGDGWVLIDTGLPKNAKKIVTYAQDALKIRPADIKLIIITHCHIDHVGSLKELKSLSGARIAVHEGDADYVAGRKRLEVPMKGRFILMRLLSPFMKAEPAEPDFILRDGDSVAGLQVIHTPGHTPGSICLLDRGRGILFVGDLLRFMDGKLVGPPITMDAGKVGDSIRKVAKIDFEMMLSGHGDAIKSGAGKTVRENLARLTASPK